MSRAAHAPLRPQVVHQFFFQYATRLNEKAAVNRLVGHSHARVIGELNFQPSGNLLGRPLQDQFTRNDVAPLSTVRFYSFASSWKKSEPMPVGFPIGPCNQGWSSRLTLLPVLFTHSWVVQSVRYPRFVPSHIAKLQYIGCC